MSGLSFTEIFIIIAVLAPLTLLALGFIVLYAYIIYMLVSDRFSRFFNSIHFKHRKAH